MDELEQAPSLGSPTLLLIPTELELMRFEDQGGAAGAGVLVETCGFGPVAAAARTAQRLAVLRPAKVLLVGIAGAFDEEAHPIGEAFEFGAVAIDGIGVGEGAGIVAPPALGFPQWPGSPDSSRSPIFDRVHLARAGVTEGGSLLLTTCSASADERQASDRRARFPEAVAEDMEGFAVAAACAMAGVPLRIVRGISNRVGDRDPASWRIPAALAAARRMALEVLADEAPWEAQ